MNQHDYARNVLSALQNAPSTVPPIPVDEDIRRNAARCMTALACHRLAQAGEPPKTVRHSFVEWEGGVVTIRNCRVGLQFWTNVLTSVEEQLHSIAQQQPVVYLLLYWDTDESVVHAWAVPESDFFIASVELPSDERTGRKTVLISPDNHTLKHAPGAPSFAPYYARLEITSAESNKLLEAIKTDEKVKVQRAETRVTEAEFDKADGSVTVAGVEDESAEEQQPVYTEETVAFLLELPDHAQDGEWHDHNRRRYERLLRDPSLRVVEELRGQYIQRLSPAVAGGKRHVSILKKNDYGKGGYHDHYWFAFYDPAAGSKIKSVQLYVRFLGGDGTWRFGLGMGNYCQDYVDRLLAAIFANEAAVADYLRRAPEDSIVLLTSGDDERRFSASHFADSLADEGVNANHFRLVDFNIVREYPLDSLPDHTETLVDEIGEYFTWAWPFFEAAMTGVWNAPTSAKTVPKLDEEEAGEVDETAPGTIRELSEATALPEGFLADLEGTLLAKQQAVLLGPPGTSKTFIARQFARYFVRQRPGQPQGTFDVLLMHASWQYENFFEGLRPTSRNGSLVFEQQPGFFLEWVEKLKEYGPKARHVLVLDEFNRCNTAAVFGELLQLLEYRGTTVRLLSGRSFVFPHNLFIIGTMNSADRSVGRIDMALHRRFCWLNLHSQPETLDRWLNRSGNNPLGFEASTLDRCNRLLAEHGIPPEQHIGHALFMMQRTAEDDEASPQLDIPLSEKQLRRIVRYSVVPYVRELLIMQFGQADERLLQQLSDQLLLCLKQDAISHSEQPDAGMP